VLFRSVAALFTRIDILINKTGDTKDSPLIDAARNGHVKVVLMLSSRSDVDLNAVNEKGLSALYLAALRGHANCVRCLLSKPSCDVNLCSYDSKHTALSVACLQGYNKSVRFLLQRNDIEVNKAGESQETALILACDEGRVEIVRRLLKCMTAGEANKRIESGLNAIFFASLNGHEKCVCLLIDHGVDMNGIGQDSPLYMSCQNGHFSTVQTILSKAKNILINKHGKTGCTPLTIAAQQGFTRVVKLLLKEPGIDVNKRNTSVDNSGPTALWLASQVT
jgi:ankyrin repeat protein